MKNVIGILRFTGFLEGLSFLLLLFIAMPLKYMYDLPEMVRIVGMAHGVLFIAYVLLVIYAGVSYDWKKRVILMALVASVVPFGPFVADRKLFRTA